MLPNPFSDEDKQFAARVIKTENNKVKMNCKGCQAKDFYYHTFTV